MKRLAIILCFIGSVYLYGNDFYSEVNASRNHFGKESYQSSAKSALRGIDAVYKKLETRVYTLFPKLNDFQTVKSNYYYTVANENGFMDAYIIAQSTYSNLNRVSAVKNPQLKITFDTSIYNLEQNANLLGGFDYLADQRNYKKIGVKVKNETIYYLYKDNTAVFSLIFAQDDKTKSIQSGVVIKVEFEMDKKLSALENEKIITERMNEIIMKLPLSSIRWYLN